jgi:hypothetical protein
MDTVKSLNLALRFLLELAAIASLGYGGWKLPHSLPAKIGLCVAVPLTAAVMWSLWVSPQAAYHVPAMRILIELLVFGGAAYALGRITTTSAAVVLLFTYAANAALMVIWDQ